ncbi:MAG: Uma2 family endonuclease [Chitinophagaceae bacterium]|nr:Uma2 family endonuclease [Anaerolineae bacterium]
MAIQQKITAAEFWEISQLAENRDRPLELINGEIEEMASNPRASKQAMNLGRHILNYLDNNDIGHITGEAGGYIMDDDNTFAPDVAFISYLRQRELPKTGFNPIQPDLAAEFVSPSDLKDPKRRIFKKLETYQALRVPLVWYFYPERQEVEIYRPDQPTETLGIDGVLNGGDVLPGFSLPIKQIFKS